MKKMKKFLRRKKYLMLFTPILMVIATVMAFFYYVPVNAEVVYHLVTDSNGNRWQYGYDSTTTTLHVSFFDTTSSSNSYTIPTLSFFQAEDASISSNATYVFENFADHNLGTQSTFSNDVTSLDLSNANKVDGVTPFRNNMSTSNYVTITLNSTASEVGKDVFRSLKLNMVNLDKVTLVGPGAFYGVTFQNPVISLPNTTAVLAGSFENSNTSSLSINGTVGVSAFKGCSNLATISFLNNAYEIQAGAFMNTPSANITWNHIASIGSEAFKNTYMTNGDFSSTSISVIGDEAFNNSKLNTLYVPNSVTVIPYKAFANTFISSPYLNNVIEIGPQAFNNSKISSLDLRSVQKIEHGAFANNLISNLYLPKSLSYMDTASIWYNNPITRVTIAFDTLSNKINALWVLCGTSNLFTDSSKSAANTIQEVVLVAPYSSGDTARIISNYGASRSYGGSSTECNMINNNSSTYKNVLQACFLNNLNSLQKLTIGDGYHFIGGRNFNLWNQPSYGNYPPTTTKSLVNITMPNSVLGIGECAFEYALRNSGTSITLSTGITYIGDCAFRGCTGLNIDLDLPNLKTVGAFAFEYSNITGVTLPSTLTSSGNNAFQHTPYLKKIIIDCNFFNFASAFEDRKEILNYFPTADVGINSLTNNYYTNEYDLIKFTSRVTIPSTTQNHGMFFGVKAKVIDLEGLSITSMPNNFLQEAQVETLKLPSTLKTIGYNAFFKTKVTNDLTLPSGLQTIGECAFMSANVNVPNNLPTSLKTIGANAFSDCKFNDNIVVPATVTSIGHAAFSGDIQGHTKTYANLARNSVTFKCALTSTVTNGDRVLDLLHGTSVSILNFEDNVTELPSEGLYQASPNYGYLPEFCDMDVTKIVFKNLHAITPYAFIECDNLVEVDLSADENLTDIGMYAFMDTPALLNVKLRQGLDINIGKFAFLRSGLETLGNEYSGMDIVNNNITLTDNFIFSFMPNLVKVENFKTADGNIPKGTFYNDVSLESVTLDHTITNIGVQAFASDTALDTFVIYGSPTIANSTPTQTVTSENINSIEFALETEKTDFEILLNDAANGETTITAADFTNNRYSYSPVNTITSITLTTSNDIYIDKPYDGKIVVRDKSDDTMTIPSTANLYCYSDNEECITYHETYQKYRDEAESNLYFLDEVIYLDSNKNQIEFSEDKSGLLTDDLIVYALRRDGIVLVSEEWQKLTDAVKYVDSGITIVDYDANTTDPSKKVFKTTRNIEDIDVETNNNFENLDCAVEPDEEDPTKLKISFQYQNIITDNQTETNLNANADTVNIVYADGCGGESFANVVYFDLPINSDTPQFNGTPTREGYVFMGWDKEIAPKATKDVIYTATWEKNEIVYPDPGVDPENPYEMTNPQTVNAKILFILFILSILGITYATYKNNKLKKVLIKK